MKVTGFFFCIFLLAGCHSSSEEEEITIVWNDDQAIGLSIPAHLTPQADHKKVESEIFVRLTGDSLSTGIFGNFSADRDNLVFTPLIPFTRGLSYTIYFREKQLATLEIPRVPATDSPTVLNVYPSGDTLPENQLKLYITFSKPMKEGEALKQVLLISAKQDTVPAPFLDLKPELWNPDGTTLTLWFDPGRVKRDLQPNAALGPPLRKGERYTLIVSDQWADQRGAALQSVYTKTFFVAARDSVLPNPDTWKIHAPQRGTKETLRIIFHEPLDYLLLKSAIKVTGENEKEIPGILEPQKNETELSFIPELAWHTGNYYVHIESRLEDLAGNNLERPFDRDLLNDQAKGKSQNSSKMKFTVR